MPELLNIDINRLYYGSNILLENARLKVNSGERILIVGATGTGKSSLLNTLNLMNQSYDGSIFFHGKKLQDYRPEHLRSRICMVMQEPYLEGNTVQEALDAPLQYHSIKQRQLPNRKEDIAQLMQAFQLPISYLQQSPEKLSGGEKQRIALIRALQLKPEVLLLDEISSALDQSTSGIISDCIFNNYQGTVIAISHDPLWQDRWQRIWKLEQGRISSSVKGA